jgi:hypothetical protein
VTGDFDGDGVTTIAVFDPAGIWYIRNSNSAGAPSIPPFNYGMGIWTPLAGNWQFPLDTLPPSGSTDLPRALPAKTDALDQVFANL